MVSDMYLDLLSVGGTLEGWKLAGRFRLGITVSLARLQPGLGVATGGCLRYIVVNSGNREAESKRLDPGSRVFFNARDGTTGQLARQRASLPRLSRLCLQNGIFTSQVPARYLGAPPSS